MKLESCARNKNLRRHPQSGMYYWRQYADGKEFFKSTGESKSEVKAERIGQRMFAEWLGTPEAIKSATFLFEDVARMYLESKKNRRPKTIVSAKLHVEKHLIPFFGGFPVDRVADYWEDYIKAKRAEQPMRKFFNDTKHMRGILSIALDKGMLPRPAKITSPDGKVRAGKEYRPDELIRLLTHANPDLTLQIKMAYLMGMRRSEICKLRWAAVNLDEGLIALTAKDTKTKEPRDIPVHIDVWTELQLRESRRQGEFIFPSPVNPAAPIEDNKSAWQACKKRAGVTGRFHDLRHTAVSRMLYEFNLPPAKVAAIVGMSLAVMQRYAHPKGKHLREAMNSIRGISGTNLVENEYANDNSILQ